jgi:hypothetical protein
MALAVLHSAKQLRPIDLRPLGHGSVQRRFTRLTNAFSKKIENPAAVALHRMFYNFVRA